MIVIVIRSRCYYIVYSNTHGSPQLANLAVLARLERTDGDSVTGTLILKGCVLILKGCDLILKGCDLKWGHTRF